MASPLVEKGLLLLIAGILVLGVVWSNMKSSPTPAPGSLIAGNYGNATSSSAKGTSSATALLVGTAGRTIYITGATVTSDAAEEPIQIKDGTTVIWQDNTASSTPYIVSFLTPLRATAGNSVSLVVTGIGSTTANLSGYYNP